MIEPHHPKGGNGRPPAGPEWTSRAYFVQHGFSLTNEASDEALLHGTALHRFVGIDPSLRCPRDS